MARGRLAVALAVTGIVTALAPGTAQAYERCNGPVCAEVTPTTVEVRNAQALRRFDRLSFRTTALTDRRDGGRAWGAGRADFSLTLAGGLELDSTAFSVRDVAVSPLARGGLRMQLRLAPRPGGAAPPGIEVDRAVEAYPGVAGFRSETVVRSAAPLLVAGATLDEAAGAGARPTIHAFRAGADWREPDWTGPAAPGGRPARGHLARDALGRARASRSRAPRSGSRWPTASAPPSW